MQGLVELDQVVVTATILAIVLLVMRELTAGVARAARQDAWQWVRRHIGSRIRKDQTSRP